MVLPARNARTATPSHAGMPFKDLVARLKAEQPTRVDAIVDTSQHVAMDLLTLPDGRRDVGLMFMTPEIQQLDGQVARLTDYAHGQVAARTGIDRKYYERMRTQQPELLMRNVETWWRAEPDTRLARVVQDIDVSNGSLQVGGLKGRAWVSNQYRPLDNLDFVTTVLEEADSHGARILSCHLDDERVYLKLVSERMAREVGKLGIMEAGVIVRNSEVGDGLVVVQPYFLQQWCTNGAVREEKFGQRHVGERHVEGILQHDTIAAKNASVWLEVRDWVRAAFNGRFMDEQVRALTGALEVPVPVEARLAVANVVREGSLSGSDGEAILERYLRGNSDTQFGLANAVTHYAHSGGLDYRRQVDLEAFGGRMLTQSGKAFTHMVSAPLNDEQVAKAVSAN